MRKQPALWAVHASGHPFRQPIENGVSPFSITCEGPSGGGRDVWPDLVWDLLDGGGECAGRGWCEAVLL